MVLGLPDWAAIFLLSILFSMAVNLLNRKMGIKKRTAFIQKEMNTFQKEMKEATDKNDEKRIKKLKERESQVMGMMSEMMFLPFKSMIFVLPLFFIIIGTSGFLGIQYDGVLSPNFPGFIQELPIDLHISSVFSLNVFHSAVYGTRGFFIVSGIVSGMLVEALFARLLKD